jgi:hypothetical protein
MAILGQPAGAAGIVAPNAAAGTGVWTAPVTSFSIDPAGALINSGLSAGGLTSMHLTLQSSLGLGVPTPAVTPPIVLPYSGMTPSPEASVPAISPAAPQQPALPPGQNTERIRQVVQNISERGENLSAGDMHQAGMSLQNAFTGGQSFASSDQVAAPDDSNSWLDPATGQYETETSKIRKAYQLALTNPRAKAIKDNLPVNPVYKVQKGNSAFYARAEGDDPEKPGEEAAVVFDQWTLQNLSPHFIAANLASMWVRHLYRDAVPQSAEKTYMEGSILIRVFMELTGSTASNWVGNLDYWLGGNFEIYRHFYSWAQGFQYPDVRQGPYFKWKIMGARGDPTIHTDERGRRTLFQRAQAGEIGDQAATQGQGKFDQFVGTEKAGQQ